MKLGDEAFETGFAPKDPIEWMPFLQAYAWSANSERLTEREAAVTPDAYIDQQTCQILGSMPDLSPQILETIKSLYCPE